MKEDSMADESMAEDTMMEEDSHGESMDENKKDDTMKPEDTMDEDTIMDEGTSDESMDAMMESPAWFSHEFFNVNTGETFTISDLKGKVVLVETMATWCSNCLRQQKEVKALHDLIGERDDFVSFGLDIDLNENAEALKNYVDQQGFDWTYAITNDTVAREIGNLYGSQFLNPPSTPMLIIDQKGEVHLLTFGIKSAADLQEALQPFFDGSM
jgi:thiol-disulfide isomerase/thioredoxin